MKIALWFGTNRKTRCCLNIETPFQGMNSWINEIVCQFKCLLKAQYQMKYQIERISNKREKEIIVPKHCEPPPWHRWHRRYNKVLSLRNAGVTEEYR